MNVLQVNSLPVFDVIKDLAKAFNTDPQVDIFEYTVTIPKNKGSGFIKGYNLHKGLGIIEYDCTFYEDLEIHFIVNNVHPLKFLYVFKGNLEHRFENLDTVHSLEEYQSAIVASDSTNGHILNFHANTSVAKFSVEIDRKIFNLNMDFKDKQVDSVLFKLFRDMEAKAAFYYKGDYSLNIADIFHDLKTYADFDGDKFVYMLYLRSIAYQSMVLHLQQYLDDKHEKKSPQILRKREFEQIKKGIAYINNNLETYDGLGELNKQTGLNATKLQSGFKHLYNCTVNQYIQEKRLEKARNLLINSDMTISEIVSAIGLKSASYFSRIFKNKYGVQPSMFNKKN